jgi:ion channel POLLUX/CASTOR
MKNVRWQDKLRYSFDNSISKGTGAMIMWLGVITIIVLAIIALLARLVISPEDAVKNNIEGGAGGFFYLMWMGLMRTLDTGTMGGDDGSKVFLVLMLLFTFAGVFIVSTLIGLLTSGVEAKIDELRKGRSLVIEEDHILILGWSSKIFTIIEQLSLANQSHAKPRIVILADKDKIEMDDEIAARCGDTGKVKIICRNGNPIDVGDIQITSPDEARTIIVMPPEDDDPDAQVVKVLLALLNNPKRTKAKYHIVAELKNRKNIDVVQMISNGEVETIESPGLIARIMVQTCRQSGLSIVYADLLDFGGCEIYFKSEPALTGKTFGESVFAYEESSVLGLRKATGKVLVLPGMDAPIEAGDQIIVLAEDDSTIRYTGNTGGIADNQAFRTSHKEEKAPEKTLILGWNQGGATISGELDKYVATNSKLTIVADLGDPEADIAHKCPDLKNLLVEVQKGDTTSRIILDAIDVPSYDHVILLSYNDELEVQRADARSLITLLHLRDIADKSDKRFSIVAEILDVRNRDLAKVTRADDFIVSDKLISLMMAQVAENKDLNAVFEDLFDPEGAEIYLKSAASYVTTGAPVSVKTLMASALTQGHLVLGYRIIRFADDADKNFGVVMNPKKSSVETFSPEDKIIIVAED